MRHFRSGKTDKQNGMTIRLTLCKRDAIRFLGIFYGKRLVLLLSFLNSLRDVTL